MFYFLCSKSTSNNKISADDNNNNHINNKGSDAKLDKEKEALFAKQKTQLQLLLEEELTNEVLEYTTITNIKKKQSSEYCNIKKKKVTIIKQHFVFSF